MASSTRRRQRNSLDKPPDISDVIRLKEEFIAVYERHYHELQECIQALSHLINTFEEDFRHATEATRNIEIVEIVGEVTKIAGLALAPFTQRASAVVTDVGSAVAFGAGIGSGLLNFMKIHQQKKLMQNVKNGLKEIQNKITPMTDILNIICERYNKILRHGNKPVDDIWGFIKRAAGACEILHILQMDDIGEVAEQVSKSVRLTTTLTGVFARTSLVCDILMDKLEGNHQVSESEMRSKAGKFIAEMRKVIHQQQNIMDELKKTKDKIARTLDLLRARAPWYKHPVVIALFIIIIFLLLFVLLLNESHF